MKSILVAFLSLLSFMPVAIAADADYAKASPEQLISALTLINSNAPGLDSMSWYEGFIAEDATPKLEGGVLGLAGANGAPANARIGSTRRGRIASVTWTSERQPANKTDRGRRYVPRRVLHVRVL